ncbi:hypothetical protein [Megavirus chiliensis]|uniref:Uncharacterized protein n=2 Tax=Megavirus chiliensis TaxID=1094892 RepID=G5CQB4_9VIRU
MKIDNEEFVPYDELAMALEKLYISNKKKELTITELKEQLLLEKDLKNLMWNDIVKIKKENLLLKKKLEGKTRKANKC